MNVSEMTPEVLKTSEYWVIMPPHDSPMRWKDVRSRKILHWVDGDLCGGSVDFYGPDCRIWPISLLDSGLELTMHWHEYVAWTSTASPEEYVPEYLKLSAIEQAYQCLAACAATEAAFCLREKHALRGDYTPGIREADSEVIDRQRQQALQALEDLAFYVASTLKVLNVVVFPGAGTAERWRIEGMLAKLKREGTQHADVRKSLPSLLVTLLSCLVEYTSDSIKSPVQLAEVISASVLKLGTRKAEGDIMQIEIPVEDFNKLVASGQRYEAQLAAGLTSVKGATHGTE